MSLHQPWETAANGFTVLDDGLSREWFGHVWLNPPYGSQIAEWMERLARHGDGIALVFARSDTKWFQSVSKTAAAMLFLSGRVRFHDTRGGKFQRTGGGSCATSPSVLIGYGDRAKETLLKCPLEAITPHHLRHAWATHAADAGANIRDLQEVLGHRDIQTTMRYIRPQPERVTSTLETLGIAI
jgi:integrase